MDRPTTPCREWRGTCDPYPRRKVSGRRDSLHRWVIEQAGEDQFGTPWDPSMYVLHLCDNPPCFRFDHLMLGTHTENMRMSFERGRSVPPAVRAKGSDHGSAKLNERLVAESRKRWANGDSIALLARERGVSRATMRSALTGQTWSHI